MDNLRVHMFSKKYVESLKAFFETLEKDPLFNMGMNLNEYSSLETNEKRLLHVKRARKLYEYQFLENGYATAFSDALCMIGWPGGMIFSLNKSVCVFPLTFLLLQFWAPWSEIQFNFSVL